MSRLLLNTKQKICECANHNDIVKKASCMALSFICAVAANMTEVQCTTLLDTDADQGFMDYLCQIYQKWWWIALLIDVLLWGFSHDEKRKEFYLKVMKGLVFVYLGTYGWAIICATIKMFGELFA